MWQAQTEATADSDVAQPDRKADAEAVQKKEKEGAHSMKIVKWKQKNNAAFAGTCHKKQKNSGAAMVMVLIVTAVILAFCLSLLLVTYSLFSQTTRQTTRQQCRFLAQSFAEGFQAELADPDSDLCANLSRQIELGKWAASEDTEDESTDTDGKEDGGKEERQDAVKELVFMLDDSAIPADYNLKVTLSYTVNTADDDGDGGDGGDDGDDQDKTNPDSPGQNAGSGQESGGSTSDPDDSTKTYAITAKIRCTRGEEGGRDTQYYELETVYQSVSL